jgi:CxxC motif-containing protein (DUF1111 family)
MMVRTTLAALMVLGLMGCEKGGTPPAQSSAPTDHLSTDRSQDALDHPMPFENHEVNDRFVLGKSFFRIPWVEAPAATTARDGLGPLFSANTCVTCHPNNGAAPLLSEAGTPHRGLAIKLSRTKTLDADYEARWGFTPDSTYGSQISINGNHDVPYEAAIAVDFKEQSGTYPDGTPFTLQRAIFSLKDLHYGPLGSDTAIAPRLAPPLVGMGLIEQIPGSAIEANAAAQQASDDGVSGRINRVYSPEHNAMRIGRFRWKASSPTLRHQIASAFFEDMSLTNALFPEENCTPAQTACQKAPRGMHALDVPDHRLDAVRFYVARLRVPEADTTPEGLALFKQTGCAVCHRPEYTLEDGRTIAPYSDFLLHDMGEALGDGRREFEAGPREWRTPPLWGAGLRQATSGQSRYLHDGRARSLEEAILWHGGEAQGAREAFMALPLSDRQRLIGFLEGL